MPYRETIISDPEMATGKDKNLSRGTVISQTISEQVAIQVRVVPLPSTVTTFLEKNAAPLRRLYTERQAQQKRNHEMITGQTEHETDEIEAETEDSDKRGNLISVLDFREKLRSVFAEEHHQGGIWSNVVDKIAAFGPKRIGPNILVDVTPEASCQKL